MQQITFYFDFVSPYAWLAFHEAPKALQGISHHMSYRPVLLGALLQADGSCASVNKDRQREWKYRHVSWLGKSLGMGLDLPLQHPFAPLPLLRLALECSRDGSINRWVAETIFRHVWLGGADALDAQRLLALRETLASQLQPDAAQDAKRLLRENTEAARAKELFGVPAWEVDGRIFWGLDSLPMLRAYLQGDSWFEQGWDQCRQMKNPL